jgi:hypothetical protein
MLVQEQGKDTDDGGWAETFEEEDTGVPQYRDESYPPWTPTGTF